MTPGDRHDDDTEEARLRRVEGEAVVLGARVGALEGAVSGLRTEVDAMRIELSTTLGRVERDVTALRAEEAERHAEARESLHWRRGMMRDACGGAVALVRLGVERFSQPSTLWPIVALVGILAAAGYGVAVTYDANGWRVGSSERAEANEDRALPRIEEREATPGVGGGALTAPAPTMYLLGGGALPPREQVALGGVGGE